MLKATFLKSPAAYFEGALQYVEVHRPGNRVLVLRRRYAGKVFLNAALAPGRYVMVRYARPCAGTCPSGRPRPCQEQTCPSEGGLDGPVDRCSAGFRLRRGATLRAALRIRVASACRVRLRAHRVRTGGRTAADRNQAHGLLRYLRRNAGSAPCSRPSARSPSAAGSLR